MQRATYAYTWYLVLQSALEKGLKSGGETFGRAVDTTAGIIYSQVLKTDMDQRVLHHY